MIFNLGSRGAGASPQFTFTANGTTYEFDDSSQTSSVQNVYYFYRDAIGWEFYILANGTFVIPSKTVCDLFLCGGGTSGSTGSFTYTTHIVGDKTYYTGTSASGGRNGFGGKRLTKRQINVQGAYSLTIGAAVGNPYNPDMSATNTLFGSYSSSDDGYVRSESNGQNGDYCFGDSSAKGPDGNSRRVGAAGSNGVSAGNPSSAGDYGGGKGGGSAIDSAGRGNNGIFYGAGGGGGGAWVATNYSSDNLNLVGGGAAGGNGYKGFAAIRNARGT